MSADSVSRSLIFRWPERSASFVLPSLFVASVAAHALAFYLFQVVYPPIVSIAPPPAQVTFLAPSSPENEALLRWASAQDPAAAENLQEVTPPGLGAILYTPSYAAAQTLPKPAEPVGGGLVFPPARDSLALITPGLRQVVASHGCVHSTLTFSDNLRGRDSSPQQGIPITAKSSTGLCPAIFLVGVGDKGDVRYSFLQESCGNSDIDREAEEQLCRRAFKPSDASSSLDWGFATFTWGADAFAPATAPVSQPSTENPR